MLDGNHSSAGQIRAEKSYISYFKKKQKNERRIHNTPGNGNGRREERGPASLDVERCPTLGGPAAGRELLLLPAGPAALGGADHVGVRASDDVARDRNVPHLHEALPVIVPVGSAGNAPTVPEKVKRGGGGRESTMTRAGETSGGRGGKTI